MSAKERKRHTDSPKKQNANLRQDVKEAIDRAFPDGIVEMSIHPDESYFWELHPRLSTAFHRMSRAHVLHEREADGGPIWWDESDADEDPPDEMERSRSYHVFFVSPEGKEFSYETEAETITEPDFMTEDFEEAGWGEGPPVVRIPGTGRTGWVVAVSLLAPFAVVELDDVATFEDGNTDEAEIDPYAESEDGERISLEEHFRKTKSAQAYKILLGLRSKISTILEKRGITVLPAEEWRKPVPWLRGGEETLAGFEGKAIRVLDAFFFEEM